MHKHYAGVNYYSRWVTCSRLSLRTHQSIYKVVECRLLTHSHARPFRRVMCATEERSFHSFSLFFCLLFSQRRWIYLFRSRVHFSCTLHCVCLAGPLFQKWHFLSIKCWLLIWVYAVGTHHAHECQSNHTERNPKLPMDFIIKCIDSAHPFSMEIRYKNYEFNSIQIFHNVFGHHKHSEPKTKMRSAITNEREEKLPQHKFISIKSSNGFVERFFGYNSDWNYVPVGGCWMPVLKSANGNSKWQQADWADWHRLQSASSRSPLTARPRATENSLFAPVLLGSWVAECAQQIIRRE